MKIDKVRIKFHDVEMLQLTLDTEKMVSIIK